jgi:hypothetical protein
MVVQVVAPTCSGLDNFGHYLTHRGNVVPVTTVVVQGPRTSSYTEPPCTTNQVVVALVCVCAPRLTSPTIPPMARSSQDATSDRPKSWCEARRSVVSAISSAIARIFVQSVSKPPTPPRVRSATGFNSDCDRTVQGNRALAPSDSHTRWSQASRVKCDVVHVVARCRTLKRRQLGCNIQRW